MSGSRPIDRIAPEDFVDEIDAQADGREIDTVDDALEFAHRWLSSSTNPAARRRCPACESIRVIEISDSWSGRRKDDKSFKCDSCANRFNRPLPPLNRVDETEDTDDDTMTDTNTPSFEWIDTDDLEPPTTRYRRTIRALSDKERVTVALRLYRPWTDDGPSYRELAALFPFSRTWIGDRVREWKAGEHRDLVPRPWPTVDAEPASRTAATDGGEP